MVKDIPKFIWNPGETPSKTWWKISTWKARDAVDGGAPMWMRLEQNEVSNPDQASSVGCVVWCFFRRCDGRCRPRKVVVNRCMRCMTYVSRIFNSRIKKLPTKDCRISSEGEIMFACLGVWCGFNFSIPFVVEASDDPKMGEAGENAYWRVAGCSSSRIFGHWYRDNWLFIIYHTYSCIYIYNIIYI